MTNPNQLIAQAAEAKIFLNKEKGIIIKDRISKGYRHPVLDKKLIKTRTKSEFKILEKAACLGIAPKPLNSTENKIEMPYLEGKKLSEHLEELDWKVLCKQIGEKIAKLHDNNIIHSDLTTSNMILQNEPNSREVVSKKPLGVLHFIDFGLSFISTRIEDKAVDLHLIKQALEAKHFTIHKEAEKIILDNYNSKDKAKVLEQLKKVESRGRYKH